MVINCILFVLSGGMMMLDELGEEYIQITVTSPHKVGDGISSYMAYTVKTHTNLSYFKVGIYIWILWKI